MPSIATAASIPAAVAVEQDQPQQLRERHQQRRDIRHGGRPQDAARTAQLIVREQVARLDRRQRAARGVELHRQRRQLEHRHEAEEQNARPDEHRPVEDQPRDEQRPREIGADARGRDDGRADADGRVIGRVLHGVARLVRRDADGRDRRDAIHFVREADNLRLRVEVVSELAGDVLDAHVGDAVCLQDALRRLRAGQPAHAAHTGIARKRALDLDLRDERDEQRRHNQHQIRHIKAIIITVIHGSHPF